MEEFGLSIETDPDVYAPAEDSLLAAGHLTDMLNERGNISLTVLDMGCGTGFLGLIAATHKNVADVFLCDINKSAVSLAERNFNLNREKISAQCHFMQTDLFSNVPEEKTFDVLVFNTPYLPQENLVTSAASLIETAWDGGIEGIGVADKFLRQAVGHLTEEGEMLIVSSSFANLKLLRSIAADLDLEIVDERKRHMFFEDIVSIRMRVRRALQ